PCARRAHPCSCKPRPARSGSDRRPPARRPSRPRRARARWDSRSPPAGRATPPPRPDSHDLVQPRDSGTCTWGAKNRDPTADRRWVFLPSRGTPKYHLMLGAIGLFVLGPICGVTIAYMGFRLGFLVASQILAGILGSVATVGYGPEGKHGANYLQTMAASVAS